MPPPDPRSSTVSPGFSFASAVGLPQPSDAFTASSGSAPVSPASYRWLVMGSTHPSPDGAAPQQAFPPPAVTRSAACPYFSFTTSVMFCVLMAISYFPRVTILSGRIALLRVQHSEYRNDN